MIYRKIYRAKRLQWDELDFDYLVRFFLAENTQERCFIVENKMLNCEGIMTRWEVYIAKDIYELKYNILYRPKEVAIEKYYDNADEDGWFEIEVSLKNDELAFEDIADVYNVLSEVLSSRGANVVKVKVPLLEEVDEKIRKKHEKLFPEYGIRAFFCKSFQEIIKENITKFTRCEYDELIGETDIDSSNAREVTSCDHKRIYIVGPCIVAGGMAPQKERLLAILRRSLVEKKNGDKMEIVPVRISRKCLDDVYKLYEAEIHENDLVILVDDFMNHLSDKDLNLVSAFNSYDGEKWLYVNVPIHTTVYGNELIAGEIINKIIMPWMKECGEKGRGAICHYPETYLKQDDKQQLENYIRGIEDRLHKKAQNIGCIVMNANPFTKGHEYLVEFARKQVDVLYVFVVEEDGSYFSYDARMEMVRQGCRNFENVVVLPSGKFMISRTTFKNYFEKEKLQNSIIDTTKDVSLFGKYIAPKLGITKRFVGEEPFDRVTLQYNEMMKKRLPEYGVELIEIPRAKISNEVISATKVRELYKEEKWKELESYVPESTLTYLKNNVILINTEVSKREFGKDDFGEDFLPIENYEQVEDWISRNKSFVIYGTGQDAEYVWSNMVTDKNYSIYFCDKKAENAEFVFQGIKVVKPSELKEALVEKPILIATRKYGREIYSELCRNGIKEERIMAIG